MHGNIWHTQRVLGARRAVVQGWARAQLRRTGALAAEPSNKGDATPSSAQAVAETASPSQDVEPSNNSIVSVRRRGTARQKYSDSKKILDDSDDVSAKDEEPRSGELPDEVQAIDADAVVPEDEEIQEEAELDPELQAVLSRKSQVILELASSTPDTLEGLIEKNRDEIDENLLSLLYERLRMAKEFDEGPEVVEGLELLFHRLRTEAERTTTTRALRLLDDCLVILDSDSVSQTEDARMQYAVERLERAFVPGDEGFDIFQVAESLGEGESGKINEESVEFVPRDEFIEEVSQLLDGAESRAEKLEAQLTQKEEVLQEGIRLGKYSEEEQSNFSNILEQQRCKLIHDMTSVRWCTDLLRAAVANA